MVKRVITTILIFVVLSVPVFAQAPTANEVQIENTLKLTDLLGDVTGTLTQYQSIVNFDISGVGEEYLGTQWLSTEKTGNAYGYQSAPADYYPDSPQQVRDWGYTLENLQNINLNEMSPIDFASWLGGLVSLPFVFVRGLWALGDIFGPLGLFIRWLMMASTWVLFVYTIEFIAKFARSVYEIGMSLTRFVVSLKP